MDARLSIRCLVARCALALWKNSLTPLHVGWEFKNPKPVSGFLSKAPF